MDVSREDVLRCARLAHLSLQEAEIEPMREAMAQLLTHAEALQELDLTGVPPTSHALDLVLPLREDVATPTFTQAQALANAPETADGHFKVPRVQ